MVTIEDFCREGCAGRVIRGQQVELVSADPIEPVKGQVDSNAKDTEVTASGVLPAKIPFENMVGFIATNGNVDGSAINYAYTPGRVVEIKTVTVVVIRQHASLTDVVASI